MFGDAFEMYFVGSSIALGKKKRKLLDEKPSTYYVGCGIVEKKFNNFIFIFYLI